MEVVAVAPPHWAGHAPTGSISLNSSEAFSLQNACRLAAVRSSDPGSGWHNTSWRDPHVRRTRLVLHEHFAGDFGRFADLIASTRPRLILMSVMSLSVPGAIAYAREARRTLGNDVVIVAGGKHPTETIIANNDIYHHSSGSLFNLDAYPDEKGLFDYVVSGDGAGFVAEIGEHVYRSYVAGRNPAMELNDLQELVHRSGRGCVVAIPSGLFLKAPDISEELPPAATLFNFDSKFDIFDADCTAHAISDIGLGCPFDCFFCSERRSINGKVVVKGSSSRLRNTLSAIRDYAESHGKGRASAFVEDSVLLGGSIPELRHFSLNNEIIPFGAQLTMDLVLNKSVQDILPELRSSGLRYLFIGVETASEEVSERMSKSTNNRKGWIERCDAAIDILTRNDIQVGASLLFGLGESAAERTELMSVAGDWIRSGSIGTASLNWAVRHPLGMGKFDEHTYREWGTPAESPEYKFVSKLFGEASLLYPIPGVSPPSLTDLMEIEKWSRHNIMH